MRSIDRLAAYLKHANISAYNFERTCGVANGYLKKQSKGKGTIGSEILDKISAHYIDLSLTWLITGKGEMIRNPYPPTPDSSNLLGDPQVPYPATHTIQALHEKIRFLENVIADKQKIILLLEQQLQKSNPQITEI